MSKNLISETVKLLKQTLPFIMVTATFIGLGYTYGYSLIPYHFGESFEFAKLGYASLVGC